MLIKNLHGWFSAGIGEEGEVNYFIILEFFS
jgi:hypothetical protein